MRRRVVRALGTCALALVAQSRAALAHDVPAGGGVSALGVVASATGLDARVCPGTPCDASTGDRRETFDVPERFRKGLPKAVFETLPIGKGKQIAQITVTDPDEGDRFVAVVAATKEGPKLLFGDVAAPSADRTAREPKMFSVRAGAESKQLLVGERSGSVHLCGRPTLLSARVLDPADLAWKGVKVQQLGEKERAAATPLTLVKATDTPPFGRLLSAIGASSALSKGPLAATDGDLATAWSEGRGADGHGELLVTRISGDVPITRVRITPLPSLGKDGAPLPPELAAPKRAFLVTDGPVFRLDFPAGLGPGDTLSARLPNELKTTCVAFVLDQGAKEEKTTAVTLAEVNVGSRLDDVKIDAGALIGSLAGGGPDARAAAALLDGGGPEVFPAIEKQYAHLDDAGRVLALTVLDGAPCEVSAKTYVRALASKYEAESAHAAARLARCGRKAAPPLLAIVADVADPARFRAAEELSVLAPDLLLPVLAKRTSEESAGVRKALRTSLGRAARAPRAEAALAALLSDQALPGDRTIELLRAAGAQLGQAAVAGAAEQALERIAPADAPFETRYLAMGPAAILAMSGRENSLHRLEGALEAPDLRLRVEAVRALGSFPSQRAKVLPRVQDPEPRVRQALAQALRVLDDQASRQALLALLRDEWTFVRTAALDSLANAGADPAVDQALVAALPKERVPGAQQRFVDAVAARKIFAAGPGLLALATGERTMLDVRARATVALGRVCHAPSEATLVALANKGLAPFAERDDATLGHAAVAALARLELPGLAPRLSPEARKVLSEVKAVLEPDDRCQAGGRTASL